MAAIISSMPGRVIDIKVKVGDKIRVKGHSEDFTQDVTSLQIEHATVTEAKAGDAVGIRVANKVHEHDKVYKVTGE